MKYSAIIRTKNSEKTIQSCLKSLLNQTIKPYNIIIVDSGSRDNTLEIVRKFPVQIVDYPKNIKFNYSKALNIGIKQSKSDFILVLSSHVQLLNRQTIEWMFFTLTKSSDCIAVSVERSSFRQNDVIAYSSVKLNEVSSKNFGGRAMFNFCSFFKYCHWKSYPFNENLPTCEDQDWSYHFLKQGYRTIIIKKPTVYYNNPYYNLRKDIQETIVIGEYIYPKFLSNFYVKILFRAAIVNYKKKNFKNGRNNLFIALSIIRHKYIKKYSFNSIYSKQLK